MALDFMNIKMYTVYHFLFKANVVVFKTTQNSDTFKAHHIELICAAKYNMNKRIVNIKRFKSVGPSIITLRVNYTL